MREYMVVKLSASSSNFAWTGKPHINSFTSNNSDNKIDVDFYHGDESNSPYNTTHLSLILSICLDNLSLYLFFVIKSKTLTNNLKHKIIIFFFL